MRSARILSLTLSATAFMAGGCSKKAEYDCKKYMGAEPSGTLTSPWSDIGLPSKNGVVCRSTEAGALLVFHSAGGYGQLGLESQKALEAKGWKPIAVKDDKAPASIPGGGELRVVLEKTGEKAQIELRTQGENTSVYKDEPVVLDVAYCEMRAPPTGRTYRGCRTD